MVFNYYYFFFNILATNTASVNKKTMAGMNRDNLSENDNSFSGNIDL